MKSLGNLQKSQNTVSWRPGKSQNDSKQTSFIYAVTLLFFYKIEHVSTILNISFKTRQVRNATAYFKIDRICLLQFPSLLKFVFNIKEKKKKYLALQKPCDTY